MAEIDKSGWIAIKYVGVKGREVDHNYGSWVVWNATGEIQLVPPESAVKLLKHPEFEDARHNFQKGKPIKVEAKEPKPEDEPDHPLISLEASTKHEIALYAKRNFGIDVDLGHKKSELVDQVRGLMNTTGRRS